MVGDRERCGGLAGHGVAAIGVRESAMEDVEAVAETVGWRMTEPHRD